MLPRPTGASFLFSEKVLALCFRMSYNIYMKTNRERENRKGGDDRARTKLTARIDSDVLDKVDALAVKEDCNRSYMVEKILREAVEDK